SDLRERAGEGAENGRRRQSDDDFALVAAKRRAHSPGEVREVIEVASESRRAAKGGPRNTLDIHAVPHFAPRVAPRGIDIRSIAADDARRAAAANGFDREIAEELRRRRFVGREILIEEQKTSRVVAHRDSAI